MSKRQPLYRIDRSPAAMKAARTAAGLTQAQAVELVDLGAPERWTEYESGRRQIDLVRYEWFLALTNQHPAYRLTRRKE